MKYYKKIVAIILIASMMFLIGCSTNEENSPQKESSEIEFNMTLEEITDKYLSSVAFYLFNNHNYGENNEFFKADRLVYLKATLEILYKKDTGTPIYDGNHYVKVSDYIETAKKYFDVSEEELENLFGDEEKVPMTDGLGNVTTGKAIDYTFENNILTIEYKFGVPEYDAKNDDYIMNQYNLNTIKIQLFEDGTFKYLSNEVGEEVKSEEDIDILSEENIGPLFPDDPHNPEIMDILEVYENLQGFWGIEKEIEKESLVYHFYLKGETAYVDVYETEQDNENYIFIYTATITDIVLDKDGNYHFSAKGDYISPNGDINLVNGMAIEVDFGQRGDNKIEIYREEYIYIGDEL